jgi:hypothetical protein
MNSEDLENLFGKDPAKIYVFSGEVDSGTDPVEFITLDFARAAGTNLIDAVVSNINGTWIVYTRNTTVEDQNFTLFLELPLPEPIIEEPAPEPSEGGE